MPSFVLDQRDEEIRILIGKSFFILWMFVNDCLDGDFEVVDVAVVVEFRKNVLQ